MGKVRRMTADEVMALMWKFERTDIVWRSLDGRQVVVVSANSDIDAYSLFVDEKGWCKRR